ncbi:MAG: DUF3021 domain-containing protein [Paraclostridium dentum]|uniref:DUF3021 domain-containing protein n=1 Tax=Paraclostridium bifermentans TaxID=1490 RepID=A0A5P3XFQ1_PARBF|nr:DUF3021 domain-containing protein [Paraclostridium bifermentans]MCU9807607.1 DUF3021 domain-containing protein [Paraclostridium sp. AKS46]QEZ69155.1 DUF3021 domain-containing protein [Paraclostridium bifermentans]
MKNIISIKKIVSNILYGIAWGCTIFTLQGIIVASTDNNYLMMTNKEYIVNAICSVIIGIGFYLPSIVYENDRISRGLQVVVHMGIGISIYLICAFYAEWIPVERGMAVTISSIIIIVTISFIIWGAFYIYNKNEARKINEKLQEK